MKKIKHLKRGGGIFVPFFMKEIIHDKIFALRKDSVCILRKMWYDS